MLYSIKNIQDLEYLNEKVSLQSQLKPLRLQDQLRKQNFNDDMTKVFEPLSATLKDVSEHVTKR